MPTERVAAVTSSLKRCLEAPGFIDHFLDLLALRAPQVREYLATQSGAQQAVTTRRCITTLLIAVGGALPMAEARRRFAACGCTGGLGMTPEMFPVWAACLLDTVRRHDTGIGPELEAAWRRVLDAAGRELVASADAPCADGGD